MSITNKEIESIAKGFAPAFREYVEKEVQPLKAKIAALEAKLDGFILGRHATDYEDRNDF